MRDLNEPDLRRLDFAPGEPVRLANGQDWTLPTVGARVVSRIGPDGPVAVIGDGEEDSATRVATRGTQGMAAVERAALKAAQAQERAAQRAADAKARASRKAAEQQVRDAQKLADTKARIAQRAADRHARIEQQAADQEAQQAQRAAHAKTRSAQWAQDRLRQADGRRGPGRGEPDRRDPQHGRGQV